MCQLCIKTTIKNKRGHLHKLFITCSLTTKAKLKISAEYDISGSPKAIDLIKK